MVWYLLLMLVQIVPLHVVSERLMASKSYDCQVKVQQRSAHCAEATVGLSCLSERLTPCPDVS